MSAPMLPAVEDKPRWSLEEDETIPRTPPKIPRAAFIGGLSALAFTTGITIAMIPALRRNRQRSLGTVNRATTEFISNNHIKYHQLEPRVGDAVATQDPSALAGIPGGMPKPARPRLPTARPEPTLFSQIRPPPMETAPPPPSASFTRYSGPESILYPSDGPSTFPLSLSGQARSSTGEGDEQEHEQERDDDPAAAISPLFALKAFGIATAVVGGLAIFGAWAVGKGMGVNDMDEFTQSLRRKTNTSLPALTTALYLPPPELTPEQIAEQDAFEAVPGRKSEDDGVVSEWGRWIAGEVEKERKGLVDGRREGRWSA